MKLAVLIVLAAACSGDPPPARQPTPVKLAAVEQASPSATTRYSAQIVPAVEVKISFKVGGYVETIGHADDVDGKPRLLQEGDAVKTGDLLVALREQELQNSVDAARAERARAAALAKQARRELPRSEKLAKTGALPGAELDRVRAEASASSAGLRSAQARYKDAKAAFADATLVSPINGIVLSRSVEVGELVAPGTVAMTIADVSSVKVKFGVPDTVLPRIEMGSVQNVTTDAYPGETFAGRVTFISPSADPTSRAFEVHVTITNTDGRLKVGSVAGLALEASRSADLTAPLVPMGAVVRAPHDPTKFAVFVVEQRNGKTFAKARGIEVGDYNGRSVPVTSGLAAGEQIVVQGAKLISDGEEIEVLP